MNCNTAPTKKRLFKAERKLGIIEASEEDTSAAAEQKFEVPDSVPSIAPVPGSEDNAVFDIDEAPLNKE